jgi:DNA-binding PadR family transcriptional regulator
VQDSALYQALHRLEGRGLAAAEWGVTANNQRARYYQLTDAGRAHLAAETDRWVRYARTVTDILTAAPTPA